MTPILKQLTRKRGAVAVEFTLVFIFAAFAFTVAIRFFLAVLSDEVAGYAAYKGARALMVSRGADVPKVIREIAPWIDEENIKFGERELAKKGLYSRWVELRHRQGGRIVAEMLAEEIERKKCEDNPLWNISGGEPCE